MITIKKKQILILITIFLGITILLFFLVISPLFKGIKKNSADIILIKKELISLDSQTKNLEEFRKFYQKNQSDLEKINKLFINPEIPIDFVNFLEKAAQDSKISIKISLSQYGGTKKDTWPSIQFQISASGPFTDFLKFIEKIETSPYLIEIQNLNINRSTETSPSLTGPKETPRVEVKANLTIKVYTQ